MPLVDRAAFFLAKKYFFGERNIYSKIFTFLSILGIAMGVFAMIVVLSVMKGFEKTVKEKILGVNAHLIIFPSRVDSWISYSERIKNIKGVKLVFPYVQAQAILNSEFGSEGCAVRGVTDDFFKHLVERGWLKKGKIPEKGEIIIGKQLARSRGIFVGDTVRLIGAKGDFYMFGFIPRVRSYKVSGIFEIGLYDFDSGIVFGRLEDIMDFSGERITGFEVYVEDPVKVDNIAGRIKKVLGNVPIITWKDLNKNLFSALKLERITMFVILAFMAFVASFNIVSSLFFNVMERKRDIAVLMAFGAEKSFVKRVFLYEGLFLGLSGALIGIISGISAIVLLEKYRIIKLPSDIYLISHLPAQLDPFYILLTVIFSIFLSLFGSFLPSRWASSLEPSEVLRHE